jgi:hypothetical protein
MIGDPGRSTLAETPASLPHHRSSYGLPTMTRAGIGGITGTNSFNNGDLRSMGSAHVILARGVY